MYLAALLTTLASSDKMVVFKLQSCLCPVVEIMTINNISSAFFGCFVLHVHQSRPLCGEENYFNVRIV